MFSKEVLAPIAARRCSMKKAAQSATAGIRTAGDGKQFILKLQDGDLESKNNK